MRFPVSLAIGATFIGTVLVQQYIDSLDNHKFYILVVVALPSLFELSRHIKFDSWLGELSYPIYLVHLSVLSFGQILAMAVIGPSENANWLAFAAAIVTLVVSIAYVHWFDAPFERWRQARTTRTIQQRVFHALPQPHGAALTA
jgi:peptidoglycan/LPS O-acetylase OafA/YrhL